MSQMFNKRGTKEVDISGLKDRELGSVTFVRDYVQLNFDGPIVTTLTMPVVVVGDDEWRSTMPEYRNRLCEQIGKMVSHASVFLDDRFEVGFADRSLITVSLRPEDYAAAEAVRVSSADKKDWATW